MDFELRRAREKLDKEQKERKERARLKLQRERKAREEASKQREAIEASQRSRRLDAAQAQLKADQENQENLLRGRGVSFYRLLEALPCDGSGDKIKLPPSCFTELSDQRAFDNGPLYFQLSILRGGSGRSEDGRRNTHAGVLEFTADEGSVCLPPHLWLNLFGPETATETTQTIEVRYVWLPKGTYAKLRADTPGFSDLPNHKAVLETSLRQHATLSLDDVFVVNYGELQYKIRVLELRPSASVSVLETDLEVDIEDSGDKTEERVLRPLVLEKAESGFVEEGSYAYFKFSIDDKVHERVNSGAAQVEIRIEEEVEAKVKAKSDLGDTDIYISKHPMIFPNQHQHQWSCHDIGSKALFIGSKDKNFSPGTYSIGIYGFKGKTRFNLTVKVQEVNDGAAGQQISSSSSSSLPMEVEMDMVECKNCKRHVPSRTKVLHEAYCSRHNVVCEHVGCGVVLRTKEAEDHVHCDKCGQAFHRAELDKHKKVFHDPVRCPCGVVLEKEEMVRHQNSSCPLRLIVCRFCGDMVTAGSSTSDARDRMRGLSEHESLCGSRTAPCDSCGRSVMLKDMDIHQIAVHQKN